MYLMIHIGDKVHKRLTGTIAEGVGIKPPKVWGRVIWIHPAGRYYVAEFTSMRGSVRECFTEETYPK